MFALKVDLKKPTAGQIRMIARALLNGETMLYPTDTIYGLGCVATDKKATKKIYKIKKKDEHKPLLVLVSSINMAKKYAEIDKRQEQALKSVWPGPFSVILKSKKILLKEISGSRVNNTIGMRFPKNAFLVRLIKEVGVPIISTSANISGKEPILSIDEAEKYFKTVRPDLAVDGGVLKGKASTLIDLRDVEKIKILRK